MHVLYSNPSVILKNYGIKASKKLGQNFLNNVEIVERIVKVASPLKNETVLEIGPGLGILTTRLLLEPVYKLFCVEYDQNCVKYLKNNLYDEKNRLEIFNENALKFSERKIITSNSKLIIISNLPYNISTILLLKWLKEIDLFKKFILMVQKEVADRICADRDTKNYGTLSILTQFLCTTKIEFEVSKANFFPQPKVDSAVISIVPKENSKDKLSKFDKLGYLCKTVFSKRRKVLRNSIASILKDSEQNLLSIDIDPNKRPENLSIDEFEHIVEKLKFNL